MVYTRGDYDYKNKTLSKLVLEGNFLNLTENICRKPTASILHYKRINVFQQR